MPGRLLLAIASSVLAMALIVGRWHGPSTDDQAPSLRSGQQWGAANGQRPNSAGSKAKAEDKPSGQTTIWPRYQPGVGKNGSEGRHLSMPPHPEKKSTQQLWQAWKKLLVKSRHQQIPIMGDLLAKSIRQHPDALVYGQIASLLAGTSLATEKKALLLDLLSDIATPEALDLLLGQTGKGKSSATYFLALLAIARTGDNRWGGGFHEELSPALESAWVNPEISEPALVATLATTLAKVGAPEGVGLLLETLADSADGKQKTEAEHARQEAAFLALPQTRNPKAVPVLGEWFRNEDLGTPAFEVSAEALAAIGSPEATEEIMAWAKQAPDEGARNLDAWLSLMEEDSAMQAISAVPAGSFQSQEVSVVVRKFTESAKP